MEGIDYEVLWFVNLSFFCIVVVNLMIILILKMLLFLNFRVISCME